MSDSDDDSLPNNVFTLQNDNMTICARGPYVNSTNITGSSFRNNVFTSSMQMPANFGRQRYGGSTFDQRSRKSAMSPVSLRSVPDFGPCSFNHSTYRNGIGYQKSVLNGWGGSVISDRSIDSTASVSVADIAFAFKNNQFSKHEMKILKEAYSKLIKSRQRKKIEKRRRLRLFMKGTSHKYGDDSSERESDSSISNDDCRSIKSTFNKDIIPGLHNMRGMSHLNTNVEKQNESEMFRDCTSSIKQNTMRNMSSSRSMSNFDTTEKISNSSVTNTQNSISINVHNTSKMTQRERFKKGFLLPSQRFNKSVVGHSQMKDKGKVNENAGKKYSSKVAGPESDCDSNDIDDEIFPVKETHEKLDFQRKRTLDTEGVCYSDKKKSKLDSVNKLQSSKPSESLSNTNSNEKSNDFIFAKPKMPIKKGTYRKDFGTEKLLAKSNVPPIPETDFNIIENDNSECTEQNNNKETENDTHSDILHSTNDMSMRPSFIKRKLFTQKLDVAENKNLSSDSITPNSPQNVYGEYIREKNKTRKLVASQSCLSREVTGENNNVLDLIHEIVPPDQINLTNVTNKTEICYNQSNKDNNNEKWDITAVLANCNFQDISDTYTDEEIFNPTHQDESNKCKNSVKNSKEVTDCRINAEKLSLPTVNKLMKNNKNYELPHFKLAGTETTKKRVTDCVKSFWDTDFESDMENNIASSRTINTRMNQVSATQKRKYNHVDKLNTSNKKASVSKGILSLRNFHKDSKFNATLKSQTNVIDRDKQVNEINNSHSAVEKNVDITKTEKSNKEANTKSQTGNKKKDIAKENVPVTEIQASERKSKSKQTGVPKKLNKSVKSTKNNGHTDNKRQVTNNTLNKDELTERTSQNAKDTKISCTPTPKQANKDSLRKITNSGTTNDPKSQKSVVNIRIQPKRKSKDKSFVQSLKPKNKITSSGTIIRPNSQKSDVNVRKQPKRKSKEKSFTQSPKPKVKTNNAKAQNNKSVIKSTKELISKNISLNNSITRSIRSTREKLSFNTSACDNSSMNISNISNRSMRLQQRKRNEYK